MQKNILITGAGGFIARNLIAMLNTNKEYSLSFTYRPMMFIASPTS